MTRIPTVRRPPREADRPRTWSVTAVAAAGAALGLVLAHASLDEPRATHGPGVSPGAGEGTSSGSPARGASAGAGGADAGAATDTADAGGTAGRSPDAAAGDPASEGSDPPAVRPSALGPPPGSREVVPGRVAYLRCEGLPRRDGPYPCPRDRELEQAVWAALDALPQCPTAPGGSGRVDVRLHYRTEGAAEIRFLESATELDIPSLLSCLREPLGALETSLDPDHMVVSFRFRLEAP